MVEVLEGFSSWNKLHERLKSHVGDVGSIHNRAVKHCGDLMKQHQSIAVALHKQSDITKNEYRIRLNASIDVWVNYLIGLSLHTNISCGALSNLWSHSKHYFQKLYQS